MTEQEIRDIISHVRVGSDSLRCSNCDSAWSETAGWSGSEDEMETTDRRGMMSDRWLGWHFLPKDRRLRGSRKVVKAGRTYRVEGPLALCSHGMHASRRALDALTYAPGPVVCRVELLGERLDAHFKSCARERRVLWIVDATRVLHEFALAVATDALHAADTRGAVVDPRSWAAIETKRRWLRGVATDAELDAAWDVARDAAVTRGAQSMMLEAMLESLRQEEQR